MVEHQIRLLSRAFQIRFIALELHENEPILHILVQQDPTQDNTYVTDNAYVCLTVCLTGNEELFQQKVLEKLQFTIVRQLQIQNYCNKIVLEGSVCLNPSKSSSVSVRYLKSFFT